MSLSLGLSWEFLAEWFFRMNELLASHSYHKDPIFSLCWNNFEDLPCCWLGIFCLLFFFTFFLVPLIFLSYLSWWFTLWDLFSDFWTVYMISYKLILFFLYFILTYFWDLVLLKLQNSGLLWTLMSHPHQIVTWEWSLSTYFPCSRVWTVCGWSRVRIFICMYKVGNQVS